MRAFLLIATAVTLQIGMAAAASPSMSDITAVIKTFHRPACLRRLLSSITTYAPDLKVIVVDDGRDGVLNKRTMSSEVVQEYLTPAHDTGVSASRNLALKQVRTSYVLMLDDDFVFTKETEVSKLAKVARQTNGIAAGELFVIPTDMPNMPMLAAVQKPVPVSGALVLALNKGQLISQPETKIHPSTGCIQASMVSGNFFVASTKLVKDLGWDPKLKLSESEDFFLRAQEKRIPVHYCQHVKAKHDGQCTLDEAHDHKQYARSRERGLYFRKHFFDKWGIKQQMSPTGGTYFHSCAFGPCTVAHMWTKDEVKTCDDKGVCETHKVKIEDKKLHKCNADGKCEAVTN